MEKEKTPQNIHISPPMTPSPYYPRRNQNKYPGIYQPPGLSLCLTPKFCYIYIYRGGGLCIHFPLLSHILYFFPILSYSLLLLVDNKNININMNLNINIPNIPNMSEGFHIYSLLTSFKILLDLLGIMQGEGNCKASWMKIILCSLRLYYIYIYI